MDFDRDYDEYNPIYYRVNKYESIEIIETFNLTFSIGNALKYLLRCNNIAPKGNRHQDICKAIWYLDREIESKKYKAIFYYTQIDTYISEDLYDKEIYDALSLIFSYFVSEDINLLKQARNILNEYSISSDIN